MIYRKYESRDISAIRDILDKDNNIEVILLNSGLTRENAHAFYESQGYFKKSYGFIKKI